MCRNVIPYCLAWAFATMAASSESRSTTLHAPGDGAGAARARGYGQLREQSQRARVILVKTTLRFGGASGLRAGAVFTLRTLLRGRRLGRVGAASVASAAHIPLPVARIALLLRH